MSKRRASHKVDMRSGSYANLSSMNPNSREFIILLFNLEQAKPFYFFEEYYYCHTYAKSKNVTKHIAGDLRVRVGLYIYSTSDDQLLQPGSFFFNKLWIYHPWRSF